MAPPKPRTGCSEAVRLVLKSATRPLTAHQIQEALPVRSVREIVNALNAMARRGEARQRSIRGGLGGCRVAWEYDDGVGVQVAAPRGCLLQEVWR